MFVSSNSFTGLKMPKHSTASCIAGPPRRSYSTYTPPFQGELFCTVSDKRSDQTYKHRAFCKPPALRRPELRIKTPAVHPTAGVFFICGRCAAPNRRWRRRRRVRREVADFEHRPQQFGGPSAHRDRASAKG